MLDVSVYLSKKGAYGRKRIYHSVRKWGIENALVGPAEEKDKFPEENKEFVITK